MFFEKEEKIEKHFQRKEKDITKCIAIENVEPTKRKVRQENMRFTESGPKNHWDLFKDFCRMKLQYQIEFQRDQCLITAQFAFITEFSANFTSKTHVKYIYENEKECLMTR